ncbi:MAG: hypothetical protein ACEQSC_00550 [Candidatus Nanopelagicaceae bacterium]|jgi:hypothetical protein
MSTSTKGLLATLLIVSTLTLGACQKQKQSSVQAEQPKISQNNQTKAAQDQNVTIDPDAWVVADNEIFIPVVDKLGEHLRQARQDYLKGDNIAAALAMRKGSAFLKQELPQADSKSKTAINKASEELIKNAALVKSGEIASVKELDQVFAKVYQANIEHLWIVADEQEWIPIIEMPQQHWQAAKKDYLAKDTKAAAREIRKGAVFLNLEANRTTDQNIKSNLLNSAENLEQLAKNVKEGKSDVDMLDRAFAKGQLAMGQFYESQAKNSESQGKLTTAGREIIGAFHHLQAANTWLNEDKANLEMAQKEINAVKDSMGSPNEALSRNLSNAIATISELITNLNQNLAQS